MEKINKRNPIYWIGAITGGIGINQILRSNFVFSMNPILLVSYLLAIGFIIVGGGLMLSKRWARTSFYILASLCVTLGFINIGILSYGLMKGRGDASLLIGMSILYLVQNIFFILGIVYLIRPKLDEQFK